MPMTVRIRVIGADRVATRLGRSRQVADQTMRRFAQESAYLMVRGLRTETPVGATGDLRDSTKGFIVKTPQGYGAEVVQDARSRRGFRYQQAVNEGTRPHFPPPKDLIAWVAVKWGLSGKAAIRGAWRLARHIARHGTRPNPYAKRALDKVRPQLRQLGRRMGVRFASSLRRG